MDTGGSAAAPVKKAAFTAKAIIHQKFGDKACYKTEEVQEESTQNGCPGLAIPQKGPSLYRCTLQLPEFSVVSGSFKRKKEAEQSAAQMASEKKEIMDTGGSAAAPVKKAAFTAKAFIHQKFGDKACYKTEEVQEESTQNGCPGFAIPQKGPSLYRCTLQLPEFSVVSGSFKRKKEAEQSAAQMALEKLGIDPASSDRTTLQDPRDDLVARILYMFSNEFLSSLHPLSGHIKAALRRGGNFKGLVSASVIGAYDSKLANLCKSINPKVESNPLLLIPLIMKSATSLTGSVAIPHGKLWMRRQDPYSTEIMESLVKPENNSSESISVEAIHIPCSLEKAIEPLTIDVLPKEYYLDFIAQKLGVTDASRVLMSRTIGKASSEMRLYFSAPESYHLLDLSSDLPNGEEDASIERLFNSRASYLSRQEIYGDAILASIAYTWKSTDLFHEDVSLRTYYRMLLSKIPCGLYKISREAVLTADLPVAFTTRSNWRGSFPRDLLCMFCRQHRLSEPVFSVTSKTSESSPGQPASCNKLKITDSAVAGTCKEPAGSESCFRCDLKIFSKRQDPIIECSPKASYKKQSDAIQNAALIVLSWLDAYFKELDMHLEKLISLGDGLNIQFYSQNFVKEFSLCRTIHENGLYEIPGNEECFWKIQGPDSGVSPSHGFFICIQYAVSLVSTEGEIVKEVVESSDELEFELGTGAVMPYMEACVAQMSVDQSACFNVGLPPQEFILAAVADPAKILALLSSKACRLEYSVTLLRVVEPMEDRMEKALFSPPLSKQRVEYALQHIKESGATTLVDFGCGSGSLLISLLDYPSSLEKFVGVDISQKSLARAAKMLHSKLSSISDTDAPTPSPSASIKSAIIYEGSITEFDSRLYGVDIGTCLEVIEHMEEDQASLFGNIVLSLFCPKLLVVSTPNYEYNVILQRSSNLPSHEDDPDEKTQSQACKFRNHDHKFEWTREQFCHWASDLAARHNYSVEYSGVGGSADVEPGFASQIAVFRRNLPVQVDDVKVDITECYSVVWEWNALNR